MPPQDRGEPVAIAPEPGKGPRFVASLPFDMQCRQPGIFSAGVPQKIDITVFIHEL
jgi:hypothetical protein